MGTKNHDWSPLRGVLGREGEVSFIDRLMREMTKYDVRLPQKSVDGEGNTIYELSFPGAKKDSISVKLNVVEHKLLISQSNHVESGEEKTEETVNVVLPVSPYVTSDKIHVTYVEGLLKVKISHISKEEVETALVPISVN